MSYYTLSESEIAELKSLRDGARAAVEQGNHFYWMIYLRLADILESKGVPATNETVLWLRGATQANAGQGAMSALIRVYSGTQYFLRYGEEIDGSLMQAASDRVSENLLRDILGENSDWNRGDESPRVSRRLQPLREWSHYEYPQE